MHLNILERGIHKASGVLSVWERWVLTEERQHLDGRIKDLTFSSLKMRKAEFTTAQRAAEEARTVAAPGKGSSDPVAPLAPAIVRIKPTALPIFTGSMREYHRWRKDWECLLSQGEPSGSAKVKRIQILNSVDERISSDLRLSTRNTAE